MKALLPEMRQRFGLAWDSGLLMVSAFIGGLMLFIFHAVMKRLLGGEGYASLVALLGLLNFMALPTIAITFTMSRFVAEHVHENAVAAWVTIFRRALRKITAYSLLGLLIWTLLSGWLADFFAAPSVISIVLLGLVAVIGLHLPVITGTLQGGRMFGQLALVRIASPAIRLFFCVGAVLLGGGVAGALGAIAAGLLATIAIAAIPFRRVVADTPPLRDYDTAPIYRYLLPVLLSQAAFLLLLHADIIFFKRFLYGEYGELKAAYAQAATLSRSVVFIAQPLALAMFPRAVNSDKRIIFWGPMLFAFAASLAVALVISLFPEIPFRLMYATDDPACFAIARRYVWAALPLSLTGIALRYLWARKLTGRVLLLFPLALTYLAILYIYHRSPEQIIACLAIGGWGGLILLLYCILKQGHRDSGRNRFLLISLGGAGDTLMASPMIEELRKAYPQAQIDMITMQGTAARDVGDNNPWIDNRYHFEFMRSGLLQSLRYCLRLRKNHYDTSFNLMPQNRLEYNLIAFLIGARERIGFDFEIKCGAMGAIFLTRRVKERVDEHLVDNNLRLVSEGLGIELPKEQRRLKLNLFKHNQDFADDFIRTHNLEDRVLIGLHPGSGTTKNLVKKRWPADKWPELVRRLAGDSNCAVLLFGSKEEFPLRQMIIRQSGLAVGDVLDVGNHNILDVAALLGRMRVFICNDALLTHIAAALNVPAVVIMGPLNPDSTHPYGGAPYRIVRTGIECSPCYGYSKYGIRCVQKEKFKCLKDINPSDVYNAYKELEIGDE